MPVSNQVIPLVVTTPVATSQASPLSTVVPVTSATLNWIELRIPPGHSGLTGISVQYNGVSIVPWASPPQFLQGDNDNLHFDVGEPIGGKLVVVTYNLDNVFPHSHHLRFGVTPFSLATAAIATIAQVPVA